MELAAIIILIIVTVIFSKKKYYEDKDASVNKDGEVCCPKCKSTQISANKRGITLTTGLIGSQKVYITCLKCGYRWKA